MPQLAIYERLARNLSAAFCFGIASLSVLDVILRPMRVEFFWAAEGVPILMAWAVFFALPAVTRTRSHLALDFLGKRTRPRLRKTLQVITDLVMLLYIGVLVYYCGRMAWNSYLTDLRSASILRLPVVYSQVGVVIGLLLLFVTQFLMIVRESLNGGVADPNAPGAPGQP